MGGKEAETETSTRPGMEITQGCALLMFRDVA